MSYLSIPYLHTTCNVTKVEIHKHIYKLQIVIKMFKYDNYQCIYIPNILITSIVLCLIYSTKVQDQIVPIQQLTDQFIEQKKINHLGYSVVTKYCFQTRRKKQVYLSCNWCYQPPLLVIQYIYKDFSILNFMIIKIFFL